MNTQSATYNLPDEVVEQLRCSHCDAYLSCGPVKVQPDGGTVCGRCSPSVNEGCIQQMVFETAMSKFTFPCCYKPQGCKQRVLFNNAVEHEIECPYRTFPCPSFPFGGCTENVSTFDIRKHFETAHSSLVVKDEMFSVEFEQEQCNLLMVKDKVVVVQYSYDSVQRVLHVDVRHLLQDNMQVVYYKLQIVSGAQSENTINLNKRLCNRFDSHSINVQDASSLIMDNYLPVLDNPSFIFIKVTVTVEQRSSPSDGEQMCSRHITCEDEETDQQTKTAWKLLEKYRCSNCCTPIVVPVYYLDRDHNILCNNCHKIRFSTKNILEIANYPCPWTGCTFVGNKDNSEVHQQDCLFRTYLCPIENICTTGFFTAAGLIDHMNKHGTYCPNPKKVVLNLFSSNGDNRGNFVYYTVIKNQVITFTVCFGYSLGYKWTLTANTIGFITDTYFMHDHCKFRSPTYSSSGSFHYESNYQVKSFPICFKSCKRISAVIKIKEIPLKKSIFGC